MKIQQDIQQIRELENDLFDLEKKKHYKPSRLVHQKE